MRKYRKFGVITLALLLILTGAFNGQGALIFADSNVGAQPIGSEPPAAVEPPAVSGSTSSQEVVEGQIGGYGWNTLTILKEVINDSNDTTVFEIKIYVDGSTSPKKTMYLSHGQSDTVPIYDGVKYVIKETEIQGYDLDSMTNTFIEGGKYKVKSWSDVTVTVKNEKEASLCITIVKDVINQDTDPTEFYVKLFKRQGGGWHEERKGTIIDDGSTVLKVCDLEPGRYSVREENVNSGYNYVGMTMTLAEGVAATHFNQEDFDVREDVTITVQNEKKPTRSITVYKDVINVDDDETLFDIDVNLLGPTASSLYFRQISESGGSVEIGGLSNGNYRLAEVLPLPEGYEYVSIEGYSNNGEFTIGEEVDPIVFTIKNQLIKGKIEVYKDVLELDDSTPFSLTLWDEWNQEVETLQFFEGFDNRAVFNDVPYGLYHITEDDGAVEGYTFHSFDNGTGEVMIDVMGETETMTVYNTRDPRGTITIIKDVTNFTDDPTMFTFNLNKAQLSSNGAWKSGETNEIAIEPLMFDDLIYGAYSVAELVPTGYIFDGFEVVEGNATLNGTALVVLDGQNDEVVLKAKNLRKQRIIIEKVVEGDSIDGQMFEIFIRDAAGQNIDGGLISESGSIFTSIFLDPYYQGEYHIYEVPVQIYEHIGNTGDVDSINDDIVELPLEGDAYITVINQRRTGPGITIIKDVNNVTDDYTDFDIEIYNKNLTRAVIVNGQPFEPGELVFSGKVSEMGSLFTGVLPMGRYMIKEILPDGYKFVDFIGPQANVLSVGFDINDERIRFPGGCIELLDEPIEVTFVNRRLPGIVIHKDVDNVTDDPTEFTVNVYTVCPDDKADLPSDEHYVDCVPDQLVFSGSLSELETLFSGHLPWAHYRFEEIVPEGYELVEILGLEEGMIYLDREDVHVTFVNTRIHGSISITKDITNLDSATEFGVTVYDEENEVVGTGTISEGGEPLVISGLPFGTYRVVETSGTSANWIFSGFSGDTTNGEVTISSELLDLEVVVLNQYQSTGGGGGGGGRRTPTPTPEPEIIPDEPIPEAVPPTPEPELEVIIPEEIIPEGVPSLPFTGGMVELEWILMALGTTAFGSGLVIRKKKEKK